MTNRLSLRSGMVVFALGVGCNQSGAFPSAGLKPVACVFGQDGFIRSESEYVAYKKHQEIDDFKYFDRDCDGKLNAKERSARDAHYEASVVSDAKAEFHRYRSNNQPAPLPQESDVSSRGEKHWPYGFVLRDSYEDISIFAKPKSVKLASGATFSFLRDEELRNTSWSAKGVVAYPVNWTATPLEAGRRDENTPYIRGFAFTPLFSFNRVSNSNPTIARSRDVNILSYGGGGEVSIGNFIDPAISHYARVRGSAVTNFDSEMRSWNVVAEYQPRTNWKSPFNLSSPNPVGALPATWQLDAILRYHFAERSSNFADPLFDRRNAISRVGPVAALAIHPLQGDDSPVPAWLQRMSLVATYSWLQEIRGPRSFSHFLTALNFAFDDAGNIGLKLSYEKGRVEETAQPVSLVKIGLSAKY